MSELHIRTMAHAWENGTYICIYKFTTYLSFPCTAQPTHASIPHNYSKEFPITEISYNQPWELLNNDWLYSGTLIIRTPVNQTLNWLFRDRNCANLVMKMVESRYVHFNAWGIYITDTDTLCITKISVLINYSCNQNISAHQLFIYNLIISTVDAVHAHLYGSTLCTDWVCIFLFLCPLDPKPDIGTLTSFKYMDTEERIHIIVSKWKNFTATSLQDTAT